MPNPDNLNIGGYRYGMNGMEQDKEVKGVGNSYTSYFRQYDPRLVRWMSDEPKPVAYESGYAAFRNNPIYYADPSGDWPKWLGGKGSKGAARKKAAAYSKANPGTTLSHNTGTYNGNKFSNYSVDKGIVNGASSKVFAYGGGPNLNGIGNFFTSGWNALAAFDYKASISKNHDGHTDKPPVETDFAGIQNVGDGATVNNHMSSTSKDVETDNSGITPGSIAGKSSGAYKFGFKINKFGFGYRNAPVNLMEAGYGVLKMGVSIINNVTTVITKVTSTDVNSQINQSNDQVNGGDPNKKVENVKKNTDGSYLDTIPDSKDNSRFKARFFNTRGKMDTTNFNFQ